MVLYNWFFDNLFGLDEKNKQTVKREKWKEKGVINKWKRE